MTANKNRDNLLKSEKLSNGILVSYYDLSKKVAGDRWLIKLVCEAAIPFAKVTENTSMNGEDEEILGAMEERFGNNLTFDLAKERNFIDEAEKDLVFADLLDQLRRNALAYLENDMFPQKLFTRTFAEFKREYLTRKELGLFDDQDVEEDDGPADFSACFKD